MQPEVGEGEDALGKGGLLASMFGTQLSLTGPHPDLESQSVSHWVTRLSTLRKATLKGVLPSQQEPGCFNHSGCAAAGLG